MAITHSYVDYGAGSDATGDGTIGTPWKTLQKAFDTLTRNTADGNQVNLKAGTAHVNSAALDLTTFIAGGALSATTPLIIRGYTSAANDGGIGEIDCGGATMFAAATYDHITLIDLEIHTFGDNHGIQLDYYCAVYRCEIHKGASSPSGKNLLIANNTCTVMGCYVYAPGAGVARGITASGSTLVSGCYVDMGADATGIGIVTAGVISGCIVKCGNASQKGIYTSGSAVNVTGCAVRNTAAGTGSGIEAGGSSACSVIANNILVGFNGAGGEGVNLVNNIGFVGYNAFYQNTATYTAGDQVFLDLSANDVALAADPFTDAANGDFSLTAAAKTALAAKGLPTSYLGAHANTVPNLNIGPIQMAAGGGSSIFRRVARLVGG